jgi:hypothetical protein
LQYAPLFGAKGDFVGARADVCAADVGKDRGARRECVVEVRKRVVEVQTVVDLIQEREVTQAYAQRERETRGEGKEGGRVAKTTQK